MSELSISGSLECGVGVGGREVQGQAHLVKKEKKGTEYRKEGRRHCLTLFFTF